MQALLENLFTDIPPYKKVKISTSDYRSINKIEYEIKIDDFCENCNSEKVFTGYTHSALLNIRSCVEYAKKNNNEFYKKLSEQIKEEDTCAHFMFKCAKCGEKHYFSILFTPDFIVKCGQYPSYSTQNVKKVEKYKNIISKYYPELTKSLNAYSQGMGVASFVYLRRILEWLVDEKCLEEEKTLKKFVDKLKKVEKREKIIPDDFSEIKNQIYSVLSKGVHEYTEEECLDMYDAVFFVIESILENELNKKEKKRRINEVKKSISNKLKTTN